MASLMRQITTSYVDAAGRKVSSRTPGATREKHRSAKWYGQYRDAAGTRRRVPLSAHKPTAERMLAEIVRREQLASAGVRDVTRPHRHTGIDAHLADWRAVLAARGNTPAYVALKVQRARDVLALARVGHADDLAASKVETAVGGLRAAGRSVQTTNHYLGAVKQFARWLAADGRAVANPLAHLAAGNVRADRRHDRRDLSDAELVALFGAAAAGPDRMGLSGPDRAVLYRVAVFTGLRSAELASLTPESFDLTRRREVTVAAAYAKNRRDDSIPLHPTLVPVLAKWLRGKPAWARVFPGTWAAQRRAGLIFAADLAVAQAAHLAAAPDARDRRRRAASDFLAYQDAAGRFADFHALRHTFISRLVAAGVTPKEAQTLARHSTITLTMDRYAHTDRDRLGAAVGKLPAIGPAAGSRKKR